MKQNTSKPTSFEPRSQREADIARALEPKYLFIKHLGDGAYSTVFKVLNKSLDRVEALKVLSDNLTRQPDFLDRFKVEAKISASLTHSNIVTLYEYKKLKKFYLFTMFYVDGPLLTHFTKSENPMPIHHVCTNIAAICDALAYAHQRGVIHRDIKASNIILDKSGKPYISDFGIAKWEKSLSRTQTGLIMGSPQYVSPEQAAGHKIDERSDVYSLGITMYVLLTQRYPFRGDTPHLTIAHRLSHPPIPPETIKPELPRRLIEILHKSMQKNLRKRYQSTVEMARDLNEFMLSEKRTGNVGAAPASPKQVIQSMAANRRFVTFALIALVIAGTILFFLMPSENRSNTEGHFASTEAQVQAHTSKKIIPRKGKLMVQVAQEKNHLALMQLINAVEKNYLDGNFTDCIDAASAAKSMINKLPVHEQIPYNGQKAQVENYQSMAAQAIESEKQPNHDVEISASLNNTPPDTPPLSFDQGETNKPITIEPGDAEPKTDFSDANDKNQRVNEIRSLAEKLKKEYGRGKYKACLAIINDAGQIFDRLPAPQKESHSKLKEEIDHYKTRTRQKLLQRKREKDLGKMVAKIDRQFQKGEVDACLKTVRAAISTIENFDKHQQKAFVRIKAKVVDYRKKVVQAIIIRDQKRSITEKIKQEVAKGDFKGALNMVDTMLAQTDLSLDVKDALHLHRKNLEMLVKNAP